MSARFITLEGVEGAGKSTQLETIRAHLQAKGHRVVMTREPGGTPLGERIRELLLDPAGAAMDAETELMLVFAARTEHLARVIRPALADGCWVVSDRFTDATFAYQGGGRGLDASRIEALESHVQGTLRPDRVLILDLPPHEGARRIGSSRARDRFEREGEAFFERVRRVYLQRAARWPERYRVIDASVRIERVSDAVCAALDELE